MAPTSFYSPAHYALIAGHGRSGTNWLLHLLDRSATTHCRNEPNEIAGNAFAALPTPFVPIADGDADAFAGPWSQAGGWEAGSWEAGRLGGWEAGRLGGCGLGGVEAPPVARVQTFKGRAPCMLQA